MLSIRPNAIYPYIFSTLTLKLLGSSITLQQHVISCLPLYSGRHPELLPETELPYTLNHAHRCISTFYTVFNQTLILAK